MHKHKKALGQHFLRSIDVVDNMISRVGDMRGCNVLEIGCGDGFLTRAVLEEPNGPDRMLCVEIDPHWADVVRANVKDPRLKVIEKNILELDWNSLEDGKPWILLANLPYQISYPIFFKLWEHRKTFDRGVFMVQEEVAQRLTSSKGRAVGWTTHFFQSSFDFELLDKVPPTAFVPPPKIVSRTVFFKPKQGEVEHFNTTFWKFVKGCFASPRRTLKNNLRAMGHDVENCCQKMSELLELRAQNATLEQLRELFINFQ